MDVMLEFRPIFSFLHYIHKEKEKRYVNACNKCFVCYSLWEKRVFNYSYLDRFHLEYELKMMIV